MSTQLYDILYTDSPRYASTIVYHCIRTAVQMAAPVLEIKSISESVHSNTDDRDSTCHKTSPSTHENAESFAPEYFSLNITTVRNLKLIFFASVPAI
jgi:hypothetical protein